MCPVFVHCQMVQRSHEVKVRLERLGLFKRVGIFIDTVKGQSEGSTQTCVTQSKCLTLLLPCYLPSSLHQVISFWLKISPIYLRETTKRSESVAIVAHLFIFLCFMWFLSLLSSFTYVSPPPLPSSVGITHIFLSPFELRFSNVFIWKPLRPFITIAIIILKLYSWNVSIAVLGETTSE